MKIAKEVVHDPLSDDDTFTDHDLALFAKKFRKFLKLKKSGHSSNMDREVMPRESRHSRKESREDRVSRSHDVQCHECEGYGHIRPECPTYLKAKGKKAMAASPSDSEGGYSSDESPKGKKNFIAFTTSVTGEREIVVNDADSEVSLDESVDEESLQVAYVELFNESLAIKKTNIEVYKRLKAVELEKNEAQAKFEQSLLMVDDLEERNSGLVNRVQILETELEDARTQLSAFSSGNKKVDRMLGIISEPNFNETLFFQSCACSS